MRKKSNKKSKQKKTSSKKSRRNKSLRRTKQKSVFDELYSEFPELKLIVKGFKKFSQKMKKRFNVYFKDKMMLYYTIQYFASILVLFLIFIFGYKIAFYPKQLVFEGFSHEGNKVYANLLIVLPQIPKVCNLSANYLNRTEFVILNITKTPYHYRMYLPHMPYGNILVYFYLNCSINQSLLNQSIHK